MKFVLTILALVALALPTAASAHTNKAHDSPETAMAHAGETPDCDTSFVVRNDWASQVANNLPMSVKDPTGSIVAYFTYLRICEGERVMAGGKRLAHPKAPGVAPPFGLDYGTTVVTIPEDKSGAKIRGKKKPLARDHGSCTVYANNATPNPIGYTYSGGISCTDPTYVKLKLQGLRRYNSTGNVVVWNEWNSVIEDDGNISTAVAGSCAPASSWASRAYGQRVHAGEWAGAWVLSPNYTFACPA